jgi:hypothetical protein
MKAYKCDRCGKLYEKYKNQGTSQFFNITCNPCTSGNLLDLCPKCNAELQEWVANYKEQVACNYTDEEIAKSFIEDVEAVKDLLPRTESEE